MRIRKPWAMGERCDGYTVTALDWPIERSTLATICQTVAPLRVSITLSAGVSHSKAG